MEWCEGEDVERELDGMWFPARIERVRKGGRYDLLYLDDGNHEKAVEATELRSSSSPTAADAAVSLPLVGASGFATQRDVFARGGDKQPRVKHEQRRAEPEPELEPEPEPEVAPTRAGAPAATSMSASSSAEAKAEMAAMWADILAAQEVGRLISCSDRLFRS